MSTQNVKARIALLDTTVHLDGHKIPERRDYLDRLLADFDWTVTTCISQLEFKATLIQECCTIHNALLRVKRFLWVRDELVESMHPQHRLRAHIFNNLLGVFAHPGTVDAAADQRLAEKARLQLENVVPQLHDWFSRESTTGGVLRNAIACNRAAEPPKKDGRALSANLPKCRRGKNKTCAVEEFIRRKAPPLLQCIQGSNHESDQINRATELLTEVIANPARELSIDQCRSLGDSLIALEAAEVATHAVSSNKREWEVLSRCMGYEFVPTEFARP